MEWPRTCGHSCAGRHLRRGRALGCPRLGVHPLPHSPCGGVGGGLTHSAGGGRREQDGGVAAPRQRQRRAGRRPPLLRAPALGQAPPPPPPHGPGVRNKRRARNTDHAGTSATVSLPAQCQPPPRENIGIMIFRIRVNRATDADVGRPPPHRKAASLRPGHDADVFLAMPTVVGAQCSWPVSGIRGGARR